MTNFKALDPDLRCVALVGRFLQQWSALEAALNTTIQTMLKLTSLQGAIVTKNMSLRDKINVVKSIVDVYAPLHRKKSALTTMKNIQAYTAWRNTVAHECFLPDDKGDGVEFIVMKAKDKVSFPEERWSVANFKEKGSLLHQATQGLYEIQKEFKASPLANALLAGLSPPKENISGLGAINLPLLPAPEDRTSDNSTATHQKDPQTPPSSEE